MAIEAAILPPALSPAMAMRPTISWQAAMRASAAEERPAMLADAAEAEAAEH